jgi:hypothetical protein
MLLPLVPLLPGTFLDEVKTPSAAGWAEYSFFMNRSHHSFRLGGALMLVAVWLATGIKKNR